MNKYRIVSLVFAVFIATVAWAEQKASDAKIGEEVIAADFLEAIRSLPVSEFDKRCPVPFDQDVLGTYLRAARSGQIVTAQKRLYDAFTQLGCVSARRFADLHTVFSKTALNREDVDANTKQLLAPVALLFFELGYGAFRFDIIRWLFENAEELSKASEDENSYLTRIGMYARDYDRLWPMTGEDRQLLFNSVGGLTFSLGDCSLMEMIPIEDEEGEKIWLCPRGCEWDVATELALETDLDLNAYLSPEAQEVCEEFNRARAGKPRPSRAMIDCMLGFAEATDDSFLACQSNAFETRGALLANFDRERTREDIYAARSCFRAQGGLSEHARRALRDIREMRNLQTEWERQRDNWRQIGNDFRNAANSVLDELQQTLEVPDSVYASEEFDEWCSSNCTAVQDNLWRSYQNLNDVSNDAYEKADRYGRLAEQVQERAESATDALIEALLTTFSGEEQCSPESDICSDSCSIVDQMVQETTDCLAQATAPEEPERGGVPPGPISQPNPLAPDELPAAVNALQQCLIAAGGRDPDPEMPPSTCPHYTQCPNGEMPNRENCKCGIEQKFAGVPDNCLMVAQCTDATRLCCPRPIAPEDTGGGGVFPGTHGGDPTPLRDRVSARLRFWESRSLLGPSGIPSGEPPN